MDRVMDQQRVDRVANKLQGVLDAQAGRGSLHNVVAAVQSHDRRIDFAGAAGIADPGTGAAMTTDTPYYIGSVTKMYTAAIVLRLCQEGRLDLDAAITRYLPASLTRRIHVYRGTDYSGRIKVSQLLDQSSGLADFEGDRPRGGQSVLDELKAGHDRAIGTAEAMEIVRSLSPSFAPGTPGKAHYSNANYRLLGVIVESVTGEPMAVNFTERIFTPLDLRHTYLPGGTASAPGASPATIYLKNTPADIPKYLSSNVSSGSLVSTASDSVAFLRAFFEGHLFDSKLLDRMRWNSIFFPLHYGYGLMYFRLPRFFWPRPLPEFIGHSGMTGSFAFTCPSRSVYLAGTIDQIGPARPFFLMITLARAVG